MVVHDGNGLVITDVADPKLLRFHPYGEKKPRASVYQFSVWDHSRGATASFWFMVPPRGSAKAVNASNPNGVLCLSRMAAVPRDERAYHISKPLRLIMNRLIDRERWPSLVTYHDESVGHNGHVYKCSGWRHVEANYRKAVWDGDRRVSLYSNGVHIDTSGMTVKTAIIHRWEHHK